MIVLGPLAVGTRLQFTISFTISAAGQEVTITVSPDALAVQGHPGQQLIATIDTVINNSIPVVDSLNLSNTASVTIGSYYKDSGKK